jgi:hypothetical protein
MLAWQVVMGADPGIDGGRIVGVWDRVEGVVSPIETVTRLAEPLQARPSIAIAAGLVAAAALVFPALLRMRSGVPRAVGAAVLVGLLIVGVGVALILGIAHEDNGAKSAAARISEALKN